MSTPAAAQALVDRIEQVVQTEIGRNIDALCAATRGGLWRAASALAATHSCHVGLITGFFVPQGSPPAAETDGPVGAALLARGLAEIGVPCRLATDEPCRNACAVALSVAGVLEGPNRRHRGRCTAGIVDRDLAYRGDHPRPVDRTLRAQP